MIKSKISRSSSRPAARAAIPLMVFALCCMAQEVKATVVTGTATWTGNVDTNFSSGGNWNGTAPQTTNSATDFVFGATGVDNLQLNGSYTTQGILISAGADAYTFNGGAAGTFTDRFFFGADGNAYALTDNASNNETFNTDVGVQSETLDLAGTGTGILELNNIRLATGKIDVQRTTGYSTTVLGGFINNGTGNQILVDGAGNNASTAAGVTFDDTSLSGLTAANYSISTGNQGTGNSGTTGGYSILAFTGGTTSFGGSLMVAGPISLLTATGTSFTETGTTYFSGSTPKVETIDGISSSSTGTVTLGAVDATGTNPSVRTISFDVGSGGLTINGAISDNTTGSAIATGMIFTDVSSSDAGTTKLSGANTYRGGTTVSGGNLEILDAVSGSTSSSTGTGTVAENGGTSTTISGTGGTIGALTVTTGSRIAPGVNTSGTNKNFGGVGTLTFGGLTLTSANLDYDLSSNAGSGNDMISTSSLAITTAGLTFNFSGTTLATGLAYELIAETGGSSATTLTGNVTSISTTFTGFSSSYTPTYSEDASGDLDVTFSSVPEPSTWAMLVIGFAFLGIWHRRRKGSLL